jgi:antitoxin ParD1/3/4
MNISISPELEELIESQVKSGFYSSASEVVSESLRRMFTEEKLNRRVPTKEQQQKMNELRNEVLKGVEQIRNGEGIVYDCNELDKLAEEIIKSGMEKRAKIQGELNGNR